MLPGSTEIWKASFNLTTVKNARSRPGSAMRSNDSRETISIYQRLQFVKSGKNLLHFGRGRLIMPGRVSCHSHAHLAAKQSGHASRCLLLNLSSYCGKIEGIATK